MRKKTITIIGAGGITLVLAIILTMRGGKEELYHVERKPVPVAAYSIGNVKSLREFPARIGIAGRILAIHVKEGDRVTRGAPLVTIDSPAVIRSEIAGTVTAVHVHGGEFAAAGTTMVMITDTQSLYVLASFDQETILSIRTGQKSELSFENLRGRTAHGTVESVYPLDGVFYARIRTADLPGEALPGMSCDVAIVTGSREALLVPSAAISKAGALSLLRNGRKHRLAVKTSRFDASFSEVTHGDLKPGDIVLYAAPQKPSRGRED
jgi:membrane fusion protein, macrolide-specific efflux system